MREESRKIWILLQDLLYLPAVWILQVGFWSLDMRTPVVFSMIYVAKDSFNHSLFTQVMFAVCAYPLAHFTSCLLVMTGPWC